MLSSIEAEIASAKAWIERAETRPEKRRALSRLMAQRARYRMQQRAETRAWEQEDHDSVMRRLEAGDATG